MAFPECQQDNISTRFTFLSPSRQHFPISHSCLQCHNLLYCPHGLKPTVLEVALPELIWSLNEQTPLEVTQRGRRRMLGARQMNILALSGPKT